MQAYVDRRIDGLFELFVEKINSRFDGSAKDYSEYQDNPVGFTEEVLGETITPDVKCLMESVRDYPITVARSANATGKTHGAARIATWFFKVYPDSQVYTAAAPPQSNLEKLLWGELGGLVEKHPALFESDAVKNLHIERSAQNFITGVTIPQSGTAAQRQAKFSGKHAPHLLFVIDEADAVPDEVFTAIESCLSGGFGRLLIMFNPRHESGEVYRMERDGRAKVVELSSLNHPNVLSGEDRIPGAVTRGVTVRRINQWCRPLNEKEQPDRNCFKLPDFLVGETAMDQAGRTFPPLQPGWYKIVEPAFFYMVIGQYPSQASTQLISREWIDRARSRWDSFVAEHGEIPPSGTQAVMGLDVGEFGTDANVACFRYGGCVERFLSWGGVDTIVTGNRATAEYKARKVHFCNVDATGVGSGVAPHMRTLGCRSNAVKVASSPTEKTEMGEFRNLRSQLWWSCREWLRTDSGAMLPPDEALLEELACPAYEVVNGKIEIMKKPTMRELLKRSPDRADALCLTFYQPELLFPTL